MLDHEVVYAMNGRMVGQVPPAGASGAAGAVGVCPESRAELGRLLGAQVVRARCGGPKLRVTLQDLARRRCWGREDTSAVRRPNASVTYSTHYRHPPAKHCHYSSQEALPPTP